MVEGRERRKEGGDLPEISGENCMRKIWSQRKYKQFLKSKARGSNEPWNGIEILILHL